MPILNDLSRDQFRSMRAEQRLYRIINALNPTGFDVTAKKYEAFNKSDQEYELYKMLIQIPGGLIGAIAQAQLAANLAAIAAANAQAAAENAVNLSVPVGTIKIWMDDPEDSTWVFANGAFLLRASYPALFALWGTRFGSSNVNNFAVPDLRGRVPAGSDDMDGYAANISIDVGFSPDTVTPGATGGISHTSPADIDSLLVRGSDYSTGGSEFAYEEQGADVIISNMQPTMLVNYVIKALPTI